MINRTCNMKSLIIVLFLMFFTVFFMNTAQAEVGPYDSIINSTYSEALSRANADVGISKFDGWCGLYVRLQLDVLGIGHVPGGALGNGRDVYGNLTAEATTSTGYKQKKYPGNNCLYDIVNAYGNKVENIVISFDHQYGKDKYGNPYSSANPGAGHVVFIHGIIDNVVYFSESYSSSGYGFTEGTPVKLSLSAFMSRYNGNNGDAIGAVVFDISANDSESPVVTSAKITNATPNSYTVVCEAHDNYGVSKFQIGTWNDVIGVDAAHWEELPAVNGTATFIINISDYGNVNNTTYHTNVYAFDGKGNVSEGVRAGDIVLEAIPPTVTMARIENITPLGYDVVCKASDNISISKIMIGTWHSKMSIDDAVWQGVISDGSTTTIHVDIKDFNYVQDATYHTNVYAFDQCGNVSDVFRAGDPFIENNGPKIVFARIHDTSPIGYSVTCSAESSTDIVKLQIGTWHSQMSVDDAQWQEIDAATGTFYISISDFGNVQNAVYHTNVYAFDSLGRISEAVRVGDIMLETTPPEVTEAYIDNVTSTGYDVICKASDNCSINRIQIGTWHNQMSIDDAVWQDVESDGQTTTIHVDIKDFNNAQNVTYHTNVYAFDQCGNVSDVKRAGDVLIVDTPEPIKLTVTPSDALLSLLNVDNKQDLEEQTAYYSAHIREHLTVEVTFNDGSAQTVDDYGVTTWIEHDESKPLKYGFDFTVSFGDLIDTSEISITLKPTPTFGEPDFTLPAAIIFVDESAFEGIAATIVYIPDTCISIGKWAFKDCVNLTQIRIPADCAIETDAFSGCTNVVIFGTNGSAAETYANSHSNCTFVAE